MVSEDVHHSGLLTPVASRRQGSELVLDFLEIVEEVEQVKVEVKQ